MAICMLQSLVLRGSVRTGAMGYLRLDGSVLADGQLSGIVVSGHSLPGTRPGNPVPNGGATDVVDATKGACPGAGRSRRHAGSPCCQAAATTRTATFAWRPFGGQASAAAAKDQAFLAGFVASAGEVSPVRQMVAAPVRGIEDRSR
jgi:hypothetical protein